MSVWSLALRRDVEQSAPEVVALRHALLGTDQVFTTGLVLQELLQGFAGPKDRAQLVDRLSALAFLQPVKDDHIEAAEVRNSCRRHGVQVGTIDALLIQLCPRNDLTLLMTDQDSIRKLGSTSHRLPKRSGSNSAEIPTPTAIAWMQSSASPVSALPTTTCAGRLTWVRRQWRLKQRRRQQPTHQLDRIAMEGGGAAAAHRTPPAV